MHERPRIVRIAAALAFAAAAFSSSPVLAQRNCTAQLMACYDRAAQQSTAIRRSVAALDCEIEFVGCARKSILGI